jgi:hypothetical protein
METSLTKAEAQQSLLRMQEFDVATLPRERELGSEMNFLEAVQPATRLVDLYKQLSIAVLADFSEKILEQIQDRANADFELFKKALNFNLTAQSEPKRIRNSIIQQISQSYDSSFDALHPYISYSLHRSADFQRLDANARATMQAISDRAEKLETQLKGHEEEAQRILNKIRSVAAEEGVTQQSVHFRAEADRHDVESENWRKRTVKLAITVGVYAALSMFLHKIPFLTPTSNYETIQLAISKALIFSVLAYMLFLSARNFLNHKHNAIVNRHRQNALMTHKALIEAASDHGIREAIMVQAAGCIFAPQNTGYTSSSSGSDTQSPKSVVELLSKAGNISSQHT